MIFDFARGQCFRTVFLPTALAVYFSLSLLLQVLALDPDNGENGTVVYSISPANPYYIINNRTGKIRTSGAVLDRESLDPRAAQLMRTIVISATDREYSTHGRTHTHTQSVPTEHWTGIFSLVRVKRLITFCCKWGMDRGSALCWTYSVTLYLRSLMETL